VWRKPHKNIFQNAVDKCNIKNNEVIHIGDNYKANVVGARNVGMDVVWINNDKESLKERALKPDYFVSKFAKINKVPQVNAIKCC